MVFDLQRGPFSLQFFSLTPFVFRRSYLMLNPRHPRHPVPPCEKVLDPQNILTTPSPARWSWMSRVCSFYRQQRGLVIVVTYFFLHKTSLHHGRTSSMSDRWADPRSTRQQGNTDKVDLVWCLVLVSLYLPIWRVWMLRCHKVGCMVWWSEIQVTPSVTNDRMHIIWLHWDSIGKPKQVQHCSTLVGTYYWSKYSDLTWPVTHSKLLGWRHQQRIFFQIWFV